MFTLQNNVPPVYMEESRDFQLLLRLIDSTNQAVKFDIDSMLNIIDPMKIKSEFLNLYATKMGFFPRRTINEDTLRYILSAFPYLIKNKGNEAGIRGAVATILKAEKQPKAVEEVDVVINNNIESEDLSPYTVYIYIPVELDYNKIALEELLKYIIPTGYALRIYTYQRRPMDTVAQVKNEDNIDGFYANPVKASGAVSFTDYASRSGLQQQLLGAYDTSEIISYEQYSTLNGDSKPIVYGTIEKHETPEQETFATENEEEE